jgi:hypothetical protein
MLLPGDRGRRGGHGGEIGGLEVAGRLGNGSPEL